LAFIGCAAVAARGQVPYDSGNGIENPAPAPQPYYGQQEAPPPGYTQDGRPAATPDQTADPSQSASFQTFYDQLAGQGNWVETNDYGYVWQPNVNDPDWAPYTNGHWVYTDDGWTWVADDSEPWGWAVYHYGRWVCLDDAGWCWVPGYTWAPAWVSWRYGGGYCGWAPLPPATALGIDFFGDGIGFGFGFHIGGDVDTAYGIGPGWYHFLPVGYLGRGNYHGYYANRYDSFGIIARTTNVTNVNVTSAGAAGRFGRVTTGGPSFAAVSAQSQEPIARATLMSARTAGPGTLRGNALAVYAPHVGAEPAGVTPHPARAETLGMDTVNRGTEIDRPTLATAALRPEGPTPEQVATAREALASAPARARVATGAANPTLTLSQPLTSLQSYHEAAARAATTRTSAEAENRGGTAVNSPGRIYSGNGSDVNANRTGYDRERAAEEQARQSRAEEERASSGGTRTTSTGISAFATPTHASYAPTTSSTVHGSGGSTGGYSSGGHSGGYSSGGNGGGHSGGGYQQNGH
jgi:hypothetical protein